MLFSVLTDPVLPLAALAFGLALVGAVLELREISRARRARRSARAFWRAR